MIAFLACSVHGKCHLELQKIQHRALINDIHARPRPMPFNSTSTAHPASEFSNVRPFPANESNDKRAKEGARRAREIGHEMTDDSDPCPATFLKTRTHNTQHTATGSFSTMLARKPLINSDSSLGASVNASGMLGSKINLLLHKTSQPVGRSHSFVASNSDDCAPLSGAADCVRPALGCLRPAPLVTR